CPRAVGCPARRHWRRRKEPESIARAIPQTTPECASPRTEPSTNRAPVFPLRDGGFRPGKGSPADSRVLPRALSRNKRNKYWRFSRDNTAWVCASGKSGRPIVTPHCRFKFYHTTASHRGGSVKWVVS